MADNPMNSIREMIKRLEDLCVPLGLSLEQAAVIPDSDIGVDVLQAVFIIKPESVTVADPEQDEFDAIFAGIEENLTKEMQDDDSDAARKAAKDELRGLLGEGED